MILPLTNGADQHAEHYNGQGEVSTIPLFLGLQWIHVLLPTETLTLLLYVITNMFLCNKIFISSYIDKAKSYVIVTHLTMSRISLLPKAKAKPRPRCNNKDILHVSGV